MRNKRQKSLIQASINNHIQAQFHKTHSIVLGTENIKIPKAFPKYRSKEELLQENNDLVFAELKMENLDWLNELASKIGQIGQDYRYPFFDSKLDSINPGMSGFRIYSEGENCIHVQVKRLDKRHPQVFILYYFENDDSNPGKIECVLSITCNLHKPSQVEVDIINYSKKLTLEKAWDYTFKLGGLFRYIMIYLRPWDYNVKNKLCSIEPLFELEIHDEQDETA